jgi:hypothetical protein
LGQARILYLQLVYFLDGYLLGRLGRVVLVLGFLEFRGGVIGIFMGSILWLWVSVILNFVGGEVGGLVGFGFTQDFLCLHIANHFSVGEGGVGAYGDVWLIGI